MSKMELNKAKNKSKKPEMPQIRTSLQKQKHIRTFNPKYEINQFTRTIRMH